MKWGMQLWKKTYYTFMFLAGLLGSLSLIMTSPLLSMLALLCLVLALNYARRVA